MELTMNRYDTIYKNRKKISAWGDIGSWPMINCKGCGGKSLVLLLQRADGITATILLARCWHRSNACRGANKNRLLCINITELYAKMGKLCQNEFEIYHLSAGLLCVKMYVCSTCNIMFQNEEIVYFYE